MPGPPSPGIVIRSAHYPGRAPIDTYGNGGFRFAGMSHRSGIISVPSGIYGWVPPRVDATEAASLERVFAESAAIDILLIGTGKAMVRIAKPLRERFRA